MTLEEDYLSAVIFIIQLKITAGDGPRRLSDRINTGAQPPHRRGVDLMGEKLLVKILKKSVQVKAPKNSS